MKFDFLKFRNQNQSLKFDENKILALLKNREIDENFIAQFLEDFKKKKPTSDEVAFEMLRSALLKYISECVSNFVIDDTVSPNIIAILGLNGSGKTTSSFKMANLLHELNWKVGLVGCDIIRDGAKFQFQHLKNACDSRFRANVKDDNEDIFQFLKREIDDAINEKFDVLILDLPGLVIGNIDTLNYISSLIKYAKKLVPKNAFSSIFIADCNIGSEFFSQAMFAQGAVKIDGLFLSKFETTRKIGKILSASKEMKILISGIGSGVGIDDIMPAKAEIILDRMMNIDVIKSD